MEDKRVLDVFIQRPEKGNTLDVIPVEVRNEDVRRDRLSIRFALELLAERAKAGTAIKNIEVVAETHLHAGGVSPVAQVPGLRSWRRPAHSPELDPHAPPQRG